MIGIVYGCLHSIVPPQGRQPLSHRACQSCPVPQVAKSFPTRKEALVWGRANERELKKQAERSQIRPDVPRLTLARLITEFLDDPETRALNYHDDLAALLAWWAARRGAERIMTFNVLKLRKDREILQHGREPATVNRYLSALRSAWDCSGRLAKGCPVGRCSPESDRYQRPAQITGEKKPVGRESRHEAS